MNKFFLSICAIVLDEAPYIEEWLQFHRFQGVEHFFIYDNGSTDGTLDILKPYVTDGTVSLTRWDKHPGQFSAYDDCLDEFGHRSEWIAFIDVDEFLHSPIGPLPYAIQNIADRNTAALAVRWIFFGSNGHREKTPGLVTERFTRRARSVDKHIKSIVRPCLTLRVGKDPHTFRVSGNIVDEKCGLMPMEYAVTSGGSGDLIRVCHFHTKSYAEYSIRRSRPDGGTGRPCTNMDERFAAHDLNEVEDLSLIKYVGLINDALGLGWNQK